MFALGARTGVPRTLSLPDIQLAKCEQAAQAFVFWSVGVGLEQACVDGFVENFGIRAGLHDWSIES